MEQDTPVEERSGSLDFEDGDVDEDCDHSEGDAFIPFHAQLGVFADGSAEKCVIEKAKVREEYQKVRGLTRLPTCLTNARGIRHRKKNRWQEDGCKTCETRL